ncbi:MAG: hypothetical protein ACTHKM_08225 [Tsuneonella sp.]
MDTPGKPSPPPPARKPRQCNADYRWTVPKVMAFLDALARCGHVAEAARAVGMSRQAAYKLRARLDGPKFRAAFEGARRQGIRARAAASRQRMRSQWDGPGLAAVDHWRASAPAGAAGPPQGDTSRGQGDAFGSQGDTASRQGDAFPRKATLNALDTVTGVTARPRTGPD